METSTTDHHHSNVPGEDDREAAKRYDEAAHKFVEAGEMPAGTADAAPKGLRERALARKTDDDPELLA